MIHASRRGKTTDYGVHLREKQKVKHYYGVHGAAVPPLFRPRRADQGKYRRRPDERSWNRGWTTSSTAWASPSSRSQARQMIRHGHMTVNGRRVDIPSYLVRPGDVISVKNQPKIVRWSRPTWPRTSTQLPDFLAVVPGALARGARPAACRSWRTPRSRSRSS